MKRVSIILLAAVVVVSAVCVYAEPRAFGNGPRNFRAERFGGGGGHDGPRAHRGPHGQRGHRGQPDIKQIVLRVADELELTEEQVAELEAIAPVDAEVMEAARDEIQTCQQALREAVMQGADEATVRAAAENVGIALGQVSVLEANYNGTVLGVLTEEQQAKLQELHEQHKQAMAERRQQMRERRESGADTDRPRAGGRGSRGRKGFGGPRGGEFGAPELPAFPDIPE